MSTISKQQSTSDYEGNQTTLKATGRHDPCVLPRATPIIESMAALVLMDMSLIQACRLNMNICNQNEINSEEEVNCI